MTDKDIKIHHLLAPFSFLYGLGVRLRNQLFDWGLLPTEQYPVPVICIGNLNVGGTGKTPHTEYIIRLLKNQYRIAVLSRGYKRRTSGFILADENSTSCEIGDEPYQMKNKFSDITIAVDADRRHGIRQLLALPIEERPEVIVLDDAFQHRYVTPSLSLVLTDYHRLFYYDKLMPAGRLREPISGIRRADIVIVSKCEEDMKPIEFRIIEENMKLKAHQLLFFTHVKYGEPQAVFPESKESSARDGIIEKDGLLVISGIASPTLFIEKAKTISRNTEIAIFQDHHIFSKLDFKKLDSMYDKLETSRKFILVTEKDAARLKNNPLVPERWKKVLHYLPITIDFCSGRNFDEAIKKHIISIQKNSILR